MLSNRLFSRPINDCLTFIFHCASHPGLHYCVVISVKTSPLSSLYHSPAAAAAAAKPQQGRRREKPVALPRQPLLKEWHERQVDEKKDRPKERKREWEEEIEMKKKREAGERESQCEYDMNINGLLNVLDENKNQMEWCGHFELFHKI